MGLSMSVCGIFQHTVTTMALDLIVAIMILDTNAAFFFPLVALLTSLAVMWCKEYLWNFSVLQRVNLYSLVCTGLKNLFW
jgi:hypothetical protein